MDENQAMANALAGVGLMTQLFVLVAIYLVWAASLHTILKKLGHADSTWMAWVPIVQLVAMAKAAGKPLWWAIFLIIPCVGLVFLVILWWAIAERRGKPGWLAIGMVLPCINLIIPPVLAFTD